MLGDFPHAPEGDVRRVFGLIGRQQPVMEGAEGRLAERLAAAERLRQGGVSDQPASEHQRAGIRELPHQLAAIFLAEEIAVVAERPVKRRVRLGERLPMRDSLVELDARARVDDELVDGVAREHIQQAVKFIRPGVADARLDGDGERRPGKNPVQQPLERGHVRQQPRALALGRHRAGGAAEVQVHLAIAHVAERLRRPEEERRILAEELGHAEAVLRRKDGKVARGEREILRRADERDEVFGHARKAVAVHPAENRVRHALQRRKIDRHRFSSTPMRQI